MIARYSSYFMQYNPSLSEVAIQQYWCYSKQRYEKWSQAIKAYSIQWNQLHEAKSIHEVNFLPFSNTKFTDAEKKMMRRYATWPEISIVLEEILLSEVLVRVWLAFSQMYDQSKGEALAEPVARSVYVSQQEVRNRALKLMVQQESYGVTQTVHLNKLRRRSERWVDLLLGRFFHETDFRALAFEEGRAGDFADERKKNADDEIAWEVLIASLRFTFKTLGSSSYQLNRQLIGALFSCFPPEIIENLGSFAQIWDIRLDSHTENMKRLLEEALDNNLTKIESPYQYP